MELPSSFLIGAIISIVLITGAFIIGYKLVVGINELGVERKAYDIKEKLEEVVNYLYYQAEGSAKIVDIYLKDDELLCFVNDEDMLSYVASQQWIDEYHRLHFESMYDEMQCDNIVCAKKAYKVYYYKKGMQPKKFDLENTIVKETFCANRSVKIYLENKGHYVLLEKYVLNEEDLVIR